MRRTIEGRLTGIRWQLTNKLEDLDFADDVALVASRIVDMQAKAGNLRKSVPRASSFPRKHRRRESSCN